MIELPEFRIRIRRRDVKNLVIERLVKSKKGDEQWAIFGYYGKFEDLAIALFDLVLDIPEGKDLAEQIRLLNRNVREIQKSIEAQLKMSVGP